MKPTILTFTSSYLPGYKGGGILRSIANLVELLGDEFNFKIITLDRDLGSSEPYQGISVNEWQKVGKAEVFYVSPKDITLLFLRRIITSTAHDILYPNSFFDFRFTIMPMLLRRLRLIQNVTTIVAPEGEFSPGALKIKAFKKRMFIYLAKRTGLYSNVIWRASNVHEEHDIRAGFFEKAGGAGASIPVVIAPDLPNTVLPIKEISFKDKKPGNLRIVFVSRISPKKNLDGALEMVQGLSGDIVFDIYGPLEDKVYWDKCQKIIDRLQPNISVHYKGAIRHDEVAEIFTQHDLFLFPTHGENHGHIIIEALVAGCPILISDQTPWRKLDDEGVGWDLPLSRPERFTTVLQRCVDMGSNDLQSLSQRAREYGIMKSTNREGIEQNRALFNFGFNKTFHAVLDTGKDQAYRAAGD